MYELMTTEITGLVPTISLSLGEGDGNAGAGGGAASGDNAPGGDGSGNAGQVPQNIPVQFDDGTVRPVPIEDLKKVYKNSDSLVKQKTEAIQRQAEIDADKKAQGKIDATWAKLKEDKPDVYDAIFGGGSEKPKPKLQPQSIDTKEVKIPDISQLDFEDSESVQAGFNGMLSTIQTLNENNAQMKDALATMLPVIQRLGEFDPAQLDKLVGERTAAALREMSPVIAMNVQQSIDGKANREREIAQASDAIKDGIKQYFSVINPNTARDLHAEVLETVLTRFTRAQQKRVMALQNQDPNAPAAPNLIQIVKDVMEKKFNLYTGLSTEVAEDVASGLHMLPKFAPAANGAGEPEKKFKSLDEAEEAFINGKRI
jgi:uncharacterized spore protein YtfJ